jgi:ATP-dependent Clp protease, protease subunit
MADQAGPLHFVLGFNLVIDRIATMPLMTAVGATIEKGAQTLTLCMSSIGGSPEQAFYAYGILRALPVPITTHNVGVVQSAALIIFLAGTRRLAVPHSTFLMHKTIHNPPAGSSYGQELLDHSLESLHADDERAMAIVAERTEQPLTRVRRWFSGQRLRPTEFAQRHGIIQAVEPVTFPTQSAFFQVAV